MAVHNSSGRNPSDNPPTPDHDDRALHELLGVERIDLEVGTDDELECVVIRVPRLQDGGQILLSPAQAAEFASLVIGAAMRVRKRQIAAGEA